VGKKKGGIDEERGSGIRSFGSLKTRHRICRGGKGKDGEHVSGKRQGAAV